MEACGILIQVNMIVLQSTPWSNPFIRSVRFTYSFIERLKEDNHCLSLLVRRSFLQRSRTSSRVLSSTGEDTAEALVEAEIMVSIESVVVA